MQGSTVYTWDAANRLTAVGGQPSAVSYKYNGLGQRTEQTVGGVTTEYALDVTSALPEVIAATTGGATTQYVQVQGQLLAQYDSGTWGYVLPDHLGSVRTETDALGQVTVARHFDPFGVPLGADGGSPFGYTGEWWDSYNQLLYLRARYYDPQPGIFLQEDPYSGDTFWPATLNGYNYAHQNPINLTDPSGERVGLIDGYVEGYQVAIAFPAIEALPFNLLWKCDQRWPVVRRHVSLRAQELVYDFHHLQSAIFRPKSNGYDYSSDLSVEAYIAFYAGQIVGLAEHRNIDGYKLGLTTSYNLGGSAQYLRITAGLGAALNTNAQGVDPIDGLRQLLTDALSGEAENVQVTSFTVGGSLGVAPGAGPGFSSGGKAKGTGSFAWATTERDGPILYYERTYEDRTSLRPVNAMAFDIGTGARFEAMRQGQADLWTSLSSLGQLSMISNPMFWMSSMLPKQRYNAVNQLYGYQADRWSPW
jgi:RHS repeat-associated protein